MTELVYRTLADHGTALHFTMLAKIIRGTTLYTTINDRRVLSIMNQHPRLFKRVSVGVYKAL
jgi:hypothetical protein